MNRISGFRQLARRGHAIFGRRRLWESTILGLSILLPIAVVAIALGMGLRYHPVSGWIVPGLVLLALLLGGAAWIRHLGREKLNYEQFLRRLETRLELGRNELVNADELEKRIPQMPDPLSRGLAAQAVETGTSRVRQIPFRELAPTRSLTAPAWRVLFALGATVGLFVLAPDAFQSSLSRIVHPGFYDLPPAVWISVEPGHVTVQRGQTLQVRASLPIDRADARLFWRSGAGAWKSRPMVETSAEAGSEATPTAERRTFSLPLRGLVEDTEYAVASGTARSDAYDILVTEPLRALGYRKNITPPAYTEMAPTQDLSSDGNIAAVVGSNLKLGIQTGRMEAAGVLRLSDETLVPLRVADDGLLVAELRVSENLDYRVELTAPDLPGVEWHSRPFHLEAVPDRAATLYQLAPETTVELPASMRVTIDADCLDDFGLTHIDLVYQRNDRDSQRETLATWKGEREARVVYDWDLEGIALVPGDVIRFHLELFDNDRISGPKRTNGPNCEIRFPSLEEMYADIENDRDGQMSNLDEMKKDQAELRDELDKALNDLKQDKDLDWESQESLKDLAKRQEEVTKKLEELARDLDESLEEMQQAELFSPEILKKVQEISELVKKLESPEFKAQMEELRRSLDQVDKSAVEKSLEQMQISQQELEQSLDRTLELLKRMKAEEQLDQMVQNAKRLLEEQKKINEQLERGEVPPEMADRLEETSKQQPKDTDRPEDGASPNEEGKTPEDSEEQDSAANEDSDEASDEEESESESETSPDQAEKAEDAEKPEGASEPEDSDQASQESGEKEENADEPSPEGLTPEESAELQKKQDELREELKKLQEELAELQKKAEEDWEQLDEKLKEKKPKEQLDSAEQAMDQASKKMDGKQKEESLEFGRQAEQDLEEFAATMEQTQQSLAEEETEDITRELYLISNQLVQVSQKQEGLVHASPSQSTRELAASQQRIVQAAESTLNRLNELGQRSQLLSPDLTRAMNGAVSNLKGSTRAYERGNRQNAVTRGKASTNTLNETVVELLEANNEMCKQPSGGMCSNPMGKMRSLSSAQEQLNQDSKSKQGKGQSQGQGSRLKPGGNQRQLADMAARQEMIRKGLAELESSLGDRNDVLGRLDDLAEEMGDVAEEMREKGEIDDRILERQQKILSRLLTAQKSIRREDEKDQRTARTGVNPGDRESPPPVAEELTRSELLRRGILRGSQDPVPDEYRSLVEDYFQSLSENR